jgi:hypothetical protein
MARKIYISIAIIALIVVAVAFAVNYLNQPPQTEPPLILSGLKEGDTFTYSIKGIASLTDPNATIPKSFLDLNQTQYYKVKITIISGSLVSYNATWHFVNGTEYFQPGTVNIATGGGNPDFWAIYQANLAKNSYVRPLGTDGAIVNDTETRTYKDVSRETNLISIQGQFYDSSDPTHTRSYQDYVYVYFDKQTGILVELKEIQLYTSPQVILTINWKLEDSNVWAVA